MSESTCKNCGEKIRERYGIWARTYVHTYTGLDLCGTNWAQPVELPSAPATPVTRGELTFTVDDVRRIIRRRAIMLRERAQRFEGNKGDSVRRATHNQIADLLDRYAKRFPHLAGDIAESDDQLAGVATHNTVSREQIKAALNEVLYDGSGGSIGGDPQNWNPYVNEVTDAVLALLVPTSKETNA